ncbi:hypothetical protein [Hyphomonas sp.]|uniref:hypothetical protein n=1 Tax=Hyphomonas sp. TaxID=87 RepID=UPI0032EB5446
MSPARPLSHSEQRDWVRLSRPQNVGPVIAETLWQPGCRRERPAHPAPVVAIEILSSLRFGHVSSPDMSAFDPESHDEPLPYSQVVRVRGSLSPMPIGEIARASGLDAARCAAILAERDLSGVALAPSGGPAVLGV